MQYECYEMELERDSGTMDMTVHACLSHSHSADSIARLLPTTDVYTHCCKRLSRRRDTDRRRQHRYCSLQYIHAVLSTYSLNFRFMKVTNFNFVMQHAQLITKAGKCTRVYPNIKFSTMQQTYGDRISVRCSLLSV